MKSLVYDNVLPPLILTDTTSSSLSTHDGAVSKSKKKKKVLININNKVKDSSSSSSSSSLKYSPSSVPASVLFDESFNTVGSTGYSSTSSSSSSSPPRRERRSLLRDTRRSKSSKDVFDPKKMPRRSSMKNLNLGAPSSSEHHHPKRRSKSNVHNSKIKVFLPGQRKPLIRRRSIHFDGEVSVREVRPAKSLLKIKTKKTCLDDLDYDYDDDEVDDPAASLLWFQQHEYDKIKRKTYKLIDHVLDQEECDLDGNKITKKSKKQYCTRGLEKMLQPNECMVKRAQAEDAVLIEQYLQREDGIYDEQFIAGAYQQVTKRSTIQALKRGKEDALIAEALIGTKFRQHRFDEDDNHNNGRCRHRPRRTNSTTDLRGSSRERRGIPRRTKSTKCVSSSNKKDKQAVVTDRRKLFQRSASM